MLQTPRYEQALMFATRLHEKQIRKGCGIPYISHLMAVSGLVMEYGGSEDAAIAGLLHDAIEDQGGAPTGARIRREFGAGVGAIVEGCTDSDSIPKPPWRERKEAYLTHLLQASDDVRLVSACDKLHNARSVLRDYRMLGDAIFDRFAGGKAGTLWYYRALTEVFARLGPFAVGEELQRVMAEIDEVAARHTFVCSAPL